MIEKIIQTTFDLIKFRSEQPNYDEKHNVIQYVKDRFSDARKNKEVFFTEFEKNNDKSILITNKQTISPDIIFFAHLDVVPAREEDYIPRQENGKIYGRGSGDMKGGGAVMLELFLEQIKKADCPSIGLLFTSDEEVGGQNGTKVVLENGVTCKLCIMPDSSRGIDSIVTYQKGISQIKIWSTGKKAHGSRPHLGKNAIEDLITKLTKIRKLFPENQTAETKETLTIGKIHGGEQTNQVPDYAESYLDLRFLDNEKFQQNMKEIEKITEGNISVVFDGPAFYCDLENKLVKLYKKSYKDLYKEDIKELSESGTSDARYFTPKNIPVIVTGIDKENSHSDNENCSIAELEGYYNILVQFIENYKQL